MTPADATTRERPLRVGILGAGPVTQAIHLPTLSRMTDEFRVHTIMDVNPAVAESVAGRVGARATTRIDDLLDGDEIDVVAICSPSAFHAEQVIAACRSGVRAVLCEKPFAVTSDEATAIADVSAETGVPIVVGAMHTFDPGWLASEVSWMPLIDEAHTIRSSIVLPLNERFEDVATEVVERLAPAARGELDAESAARSLEGWLMGLAIHDLPLVRQFLPAFDDLRVSRAELLPGGYAVSGSAGGRIFDLQAAMTSTWEPDWTLEVIGASTALTLTFTPSYVHGGSATAEIRTEDGSRTYGPFLSNGYEGEWEYVGRLARREAVPIDPRHLIDDLRFALAIAGDAADLVRREYTS
ncbi:Gfo/Idh/MocA family protein [Microbacterium sp. T32]|uniref:Gfo/Idh/MocA family protein n=1 Tax=Microbacterium sp. T32 TaxID=1776083 RepID=UPI000A5741AC|nr:Gfo/Idh/MocA family oxidoreductase [Microbacterium sp. T32]